ncbi:nifU-like protein 4, mitochondrial [Iris pallida]|uniref:NifU-like protein 4, mitochondrial n=1 Tax=Iris pallida TaxID=29817 RepID=A0AAX6E189_IRIPA|nr:nifU-like protein 4, mitochondrial [Iris pallida]
MKGFGRLLARRILLNPIKEKSGSSLVRSSRAFSCSAMFSPLGGPSPPSAPLGQPKTSSFVPTNFCPWVGLQGIIRVFFGADFITVTKSDEASWDFLKPEIFAAIMDFYTSGKPLFLDSNTASSMGTSIQEAHILMASIHELSWSLTTLSNLKVSRT